jgi:hypothetical protein
LPVDLAIPEGSTGYLGIEMKPGVVGSIGFGGHLLENSLAPNQGDYQVDYTWNCGSYYDKINTAILMSLSEDRFISQQRQDFYDSRFRAVGLQDLFPDGFRRVMGNALTGDRSVLAPRVTADAMGLPLLSNMKDPYDPNGLKDAPKYPAQPIGWTSWFPTEGPITCFPLDGSNVCAAYQGGGSGFDPQMVAKTVTVDPQIGWEVQKFIIAWTLAYSHPGGTAVVSLPAQQQTNWIDMMRVYRLGQNVDPIFSNRIEWQDPVSQDTYYAASYGKECLFGDGSNGASSCLGPDPINNPTGGKWVEKGIAARVLEYANWLTSQGYAADPAYANPGPLGPGGGFDNFGRFHVARMNNGTPVVRLDLVMSGNGQAPPTCDTDAPADCNGIQTDPTASDYCGVTKLHATGCAQPLLAYDNHFATQVGPYKAVVDYLWEVVMRYGLGTPDQLGVFPN